MSSIISVENISYEIEGKNILHNINFTVDSKDSFALIGKNGAGKTTLFEIILNDIKPTNGKVTFDKQLGNNFEYVGVVYDHLPLFPLMKVKEIIDYFSSLHGISSSSISSKYYETFGLNTILNSFIKSLSQGERKKVGLFLSIIHNPKLLILDEPFSNIDPTAIDSIWQVLKEDNRTILFTTHNWKEVEEVATKVAFIHKGKIIMQPTSIEKILQSLPQNRKIITDFNDEMIRRLNGFDFYINENLIYIFYDINSNLVEIISEQTNNFSFRDCDIKDAYLFKIKDDE